jgi:hypothetical protein
MDNIIELTKEHRGGANSTTFSGRPEGEAVREIIGVSRYDNMDGVIKVTIPADTTSFNPSFFLGLFYDSVKYLGSVEAFKAKYQIDLSNFENVEQRHLIEADIADSYRRCENEMDKKTGLD